MTRYVPEISSSATKSEGDRIHATSYIKEVTEVIPITGKFSTTSFFDDATDLPTVKYCGSQHAVARSWLGDVSYFVGLSPLYALPAPDPELMAFLTGMSQTSANADLRRGLVNVPLLLAERKETVTYLVGKAKQLSSLIRGRQSKDLRRWISTRKRDRSRVAKDIANEHLGLLFGLLPLIDEVKGAAELLSQPATIVVTGRGRRAKEDSSDEDISNIPVVWGDAASGYSVAYNAHRVTRIRYSARTSISVDLVIAEAQKLRDWGFNPLATVYDLVPLSFLSEFVSNLGTFIRALDPLVGVRFRTGNTTTWEELVEEVTVEGTSSTLADGPYLASVSTAGSGKGFQRWLRVTRVPLTDFPDNELFFANNLTIAKAITVGALAIQRYLKPANRLISMKPFRYKGPRPAYLPPINMKVKI